MVWCWKYKKIAKNVLFGYIHTQSKAFWSQELLMFLFQFWGSLLCTTYQHLNLCGSITNTLHLGLTVRWNNDWCIQFYTLFFKANVTTIVLPSQLLPNMIFGFWGWLDHFRLPICNSTKLAHSLMKTQIPMYIFVLPHHLQNHYLNNLNA
jgi:hypothetical protein